MVIGFEPVEAARRGELILRRTQDFGKNFTTIANNIFSFGYIGGFLFTSVMEKLVWNSDNMHTQACVHPHEHTPCCPHFFISPPVRIIKASLIYDILCLQGSPRVIYVSSDQGDHFRKAQLPSATTEQV